MIERLANLHARCVTLAHAYAFNPYNSARAEFWLHQAERLNVILDQMLDAQGV